MEAVLGDNIRQQCFLPTFCIMRDVSPGGFYNAAKNPYEMKHVLLSPIRRGE